MAATAWTFYNDFKRYMGDATIDMDGTTFDMHLFTSAAVTQVSTSVISTLGSLTSEVANANGYLQSGKSMNTTWTTGASAGQMRFDSSPVIWTAGGGTISNIKFAVIVARNTSGKNAANKLVAWSRLTTAKIDLTTGNTLTVTPAATGIFEMA